MDIVNFYQSAGLADPSNAKADVWEKMKGAAGGESPEELDRPLGAGMTEEGGSRSRSGSGSEGASGMPKYSSPVRPVFGLFTLRRWARMLTVLWFTFWLCRGQLQHPRNLFGKDRAKDDFRP
jgi:hypothetical protein